jgi:DMSO/TMAO reductase YedYZ heme-binding membrane subunit
LKSDSGGPGLPLGLFTFAYAGMHFLTFIGVDFGFDINLLQEAILKQRYALAGLLAVVHSFGW